MAELQLLRGEEVVFVRPIGETPVHIGRASTNDLVVTDRKVSSRHAVVWEDGGQVRVEDLGSRNGTFVDDDKVDEVVEVDPGKVIRLGANVRFRVVASEVHEAPRMLFLEDRHTGLRHPIHGDRLVLGAGPDADLDIGASSSAVVVLHPGGEAWLLGDESDQELTVGTPFDVAGRTLVLVEGTAEQVRTEGMEATKYPYTLTVTLEGPTGPEARLQDEREGLDYTVTTENRAVLLYLLGRQVVRDQQAGVAVEDQGWCPDEEVAIGIWGRERAENEPNNYHVLVCRVRKELKKAGFDAWFIEKKRKHTRARLADVTVD